MGTWALRKKVRRGFEAKQTRPSLRLFRWGVELSTVLRHHETESARSAARAGKEVDLHRTLVVPVPEAWETLLPPFFQGT